MNGWSRNALRLTGAVFLGVGGQAYAEPQGLSPSLLAIPLFVGGGLVLGAHATKPSRIALEPIATPPWSAALLVCATFFSLNSVQPHTLNLSGLQLAQYTSGLLCLALAAWFHDRSNNTAPTPRIDPADRVVLGALIALALTLRTVGLREVPPLVWGDEARYARDAARILDGARPSPFASGAWDATYLHAYSIALLEFFFRDPVISLRMVSALQGTAAVGLLYLWVRDLLGRRTATIAGLLLAVSSWHVLQSRHGYHWSINGMTELFALLWFIRGIRTGRQLHFFLSGIGLGTGVLYTYAASLLPLAAAGILVHLALLTRKRPISGVIGGGILALLTCLAVAAPRLALIYEQPSMFRRHADVWVGNDRSALEAANIAGRQLIEVAMSFNHRSDDHELFHSRGPSEPLLDPVSASMFGIGVIALARQHRSLQTVALLWPLAVMLLPAALATGQTHGPTSWRSCGATPIVYAIAAIPLGYLWLPNKDRRPWQVGLVAAMLTCAVTFNLYDYFYAHPNKLGWHRGELATLSWAASAAEAVPANVPLHVTADIARSDYFKLMISDARPVLEFAWPQDALLPRFLFEDQQVAILMNVQRDSQGMAAGRELLELLAHYFGPPTSLVERANGENNPTFALATYSAKQLNMARSMSASTNIAARARVKNTLVIFDTSYVRLSVRGCPSCPIEINGRRFSSGVLMHGLYNVEFSPAADRNKPPILMGDPKLPHPRGAMLLNRPLPEWGLTAEYRLTDGALLRRWEPAVWLTKNPTRRPWLPIAEVRWRGDVIFPEATTYQVILESGAPAMLSIDGYDTLPVSEEHGGATSRDIPIAAGTQRVTIAAHGRALEGELRPHWIASTDGRGGILGGRSSKSIESGETTSGSYEPSR